MQQIARGILYEEALLGVTLGALIYPHGIILIDAPLRSEDTRAWRSTVLSQRGGTNRLLVNLDAHPDRTLGVRAMDCPVVAHHKTALVFRDRPTIFKGQAADSGAEWETYGDAIGTRWIAPDITFSDRMSLFWGGPEVILEYHPGPMAGSIWVKVPQERVAYIGDAVTPGQPPFLAACEMTAWLESLEVLEAEYKGYTILSGRGGLVDQAAIRAQRNFLKTVQKNIEKMGKRHNTPEATEEMIPALLAEFSFPENQKERYVQRLRYGLNQYFVRRFRPANAPEQLHPENSEES